MLFATIGQAWMFLATVYGGVAIGLLYDIGRIARDLLRATRKATLAVDALFWLAAAGAMFATIWYAGAEDLRAYMILGFACGWALYEISLSRLTMLLYRKTRKLLVRLSETGLWKRLFK